MYKGNEVVFRLSLTEIAFIFAFILLVVLGGMLSEAELARTEAQTRLDSEARPEAPAITSEDFESLRHELQTQLAETGANADDVIRRMLDSSKATAQIAALNARVHDLNAKLTALNGIKEFLSQAGKTPSLNGVTEEALISSLELRALLDQKIRTATTAETGQAAARRLNERDVSAQAMMAIEFWYQLRTVLEKEFGQELVPGQESKWAQWLVEGQAPKSLTDKESVLLRAHLAYLRSRLETHGDNAALPCWFDDSGRVQFLFTIELRPGNVIVTPAWPPEREADARAVAGIDPLLRQSGPIPYDRFTERARNIMQRNKGQCLYSVQVKDTIRSGLRSERVHQQLETFFHTVPVSKSN
jgi:hypothetical protein